MENDVTGARSRPKNARFREIGDVRYASKGKPQVARPINQATKGQRATEECKTAHII